MRMIIIVLGLLVLLAGAAQAQVQLLTMPREFTPTGNLDGASARQWTNLLIQARGPQDTSVVRYITINYLDVQALCNALGGYCIDLRPLYNPNGGQVQATGNPNGLNPGAPLAPFIPAGITHIIGLVR